MRNGFFLNRLDISSPQINSPKLPVRQIQRSNSCPDLSRPIANSFTLDSLNVSEFQLPQSAEPEIEPEPTYDVSLNNQCHNLKLSMAVEVANAISNIRLEPDPVVVVNHLDKKLLLDKTILLGLLNEAKLSLQQRSPARFVRSYLNNVERAFIENKNLSAEEKVWVEETITDYKRLVKGTVSENSPVPVPPTPSVISQPIDKKCFCSIM